MMKKRMGSLPACVSPATHRPPTADHMCYFLRCWPLVLPLLILTPWASVGAAQNPTFTAMFVYGTYHLSASGDTTWHGYAQAVLQQAMSRNIALKVKPDAIEPIPTSAYPLPAPRPENSRLNTDKLRESFGLQLPPWHQGVEHVMTLLAH